MVSGDADTPQLSTRRINRLLRPLRSRCSSLASFANSWPGSTRPTKNLTTYSTRGGGTSETAFDFPPLLILHPPGSFASSKYLNKDQAELARRIYGVRDCFRDIVVNTGRRTTEATTNGRSPTHIISLAAICSIIAGDNMECHLEPDDDDNEEPSDVVDDLYDTIPLEYRRWAVLSNALCLILNSTVHHPTLLIALLEISLGHTLYHESYILLRHVLYLALCPTTPSRTPPVCHAAHSNFFLDLHARWNAGGLSETTFFEVFLEVIEEVQCHDAWACKAVHKLAQVMHSRDFSSFTRLISAIAGFDASSGRRNFVPIEGSSREPKGDRFHTWTKMAFDRCPVPSSSGQSKETTEHIHAMGEMLLSTFASGYTYRKSSVAAQLSPIPDVHGLLVCIATCCLASQSHNRLASVYLIDSLSDTVPQACTFTPLIAKVFSESAGRLNDFQQKLEHLASTLRASRLLLLEASLWACALRHIEHPMHERRLAACNGTVHIQNYRHQLIGLADDAESRCFGHEAIETPRTVLSRSNGSLNNPSSSSRNHLNGAWEWEALVGCWIRKMEDPMSARKKRKIVHVQPHSQRIHQSESLVGRKHASAPIASFGGSLGADVMKTHDAKVHRIHDACHHKQADSSLRLTSIKFSSVISDALSKRASLHPTPTTRIHSHSSRFPIHPSSSPSGGRLNDENLHRAFPPSDDSLDLFAYSSSSPIRK
ncbi:hypothetical protein FPV67DRAFT_1188109 [Lyophyllum atratum]|nr:hypothetical protein FPV67DRAFT_1188109 [Lyophyllum atratum]